MPFLTVILFLAVSHTVVSFTSYIDAFVDPAIILSYPLDLNTAPARLTIFKWAEQLAAKGPWSEGYHFPIVKVAQFGVYTGVMNKSVVPPSGDRHDYMSWGP